LVLFFSLVTLCPAEFRAPSAYLADTMETLIGRAGTFDAIFLSGIMAVLLS
jgi:hypothetical protein